MVEQTPVNEPEEKPVEAPKVDEPPPAPMGTNVAGNGPPDGFGLSGGNGTGGTGLGGSGSGRKVGGSKYGWYAGQVQSKIADAMRQHSRTRNASLSLQVRIWPDSTGRISRAQLVGSSGDPQVDEAIKNEVLTGLQLMEPPPADMPTPIVLRLSARKPN
jgi:outer membrane biosynthesis protein TonB